MTFEDLQKMDLTDVVTAEFRGYKGNCGFSCKEIATQKLLQHTETSKKETLALISDIVENYSKYSNLLDARIGVVLSDRKTKAKRAGAYRNLSDPDGSGTLTFYPAGMNACTIIHEIAHLLTPKAKHGIVWKRAFSKLAEWVCLRYQFTDDARLIIELPAVLSERVYKATAERKTLSGRRRKSFLKIFKSTYGY